MDQQKTLSSLADRLISSFAEEEPQDQERKISVNPVISRVASIYEKIRTAMDYRNEEVILRGSIERILKRRIMFGGTGKKTAEPLVRELVWARYFPDESLSESIVEKIAVKIDLFLQLREEVLKKHRNMSEATVTQWIYHLLSSDIEHILCPRKQKELMSNFMFKIMRENVIITDQDEQTRDIQVFIAVHKTYARDDLALLRYHLFKQYFGELTSQNIEKISSAFLEGFKEINSQLNHPRKDKIFNYVKDKTVAFFVLEDLLKIEGGRVRQLIRSEKDLRRIVFEICEARYSSIASRVRRAIIRSVIFILMTKAVFALLIEGTYERLVFGRILWGSTLINIGVPPILMAVVGFLIKTPGKDNSERINYYINSILVNDMPKFHKQLEIKLAPDKIKPFLNAVFTILWLVSFVLTFGVIVYILTKLHFNIVSMGIFVFFLAIVSFISYRINQSAHVYSIEEKKQAIVPIIDFLFIPFVRVGRSLTDGIAQLNLILFIFDFIIEAPFKGIFSFFEQWFLFLQTKREELE